MSYDFHWLDFLHQASGWHCHQLPARTPHCGTEPFPVCFRCAGWQFGLLAAYLGLAFEQKWKTSFPATRIALSCAALMLPLVIDGLGNTLRLWNSPDWLRAATGLFFGLSVPWLLAPLAHNRAHLAPVSLKNLRSLLWPALAGMTAVGALLVGPPPAAFALLSTAATLGWLVFIGHFLFALVRSYRHGSFVWLARLGAPRFRP